MQAQILLYLRSITTPFLDQLAEIITMFAEDTIILLIGLAIYWCIDKKRGIAILSTVLSATIMTNGIKSIVRMPRPFTVVKGLKGNRLETATGYSFPSGHSTAGSSFYGSIAVAFKKKGISIICAILIILIALSRMVLGVHWPLDVAGGLILGLLMAFFAYGMFYRLTEEQIASRYLIASLAMEAASIVLLILLWTGVAPTILFNDLMRTLAMTAACFFGASMDARSLHFKVDGTILQKVLRYLCGIAGIVILMAMKHLFGKNLTYLGSQIIYVLIGLWITWLFPLIGKKVGLFTKEE